VLTVDIILLTKNQHVLLIRRGKEPFKNCWAFPGGRVEPFDEDLLAAAKRELKEETNISDIDLIQSLTVGNKYRDPRGFCLTVVFTAVLPTTIPIRAGDDAIEASWVDITKCNHKILAFDHYDLLTKVTSQYGGLLRDTCT
jgi:ADP-ribose pyrophosphatase YjhB (NUDIX family)